MIKDKKVLTIKQSFQASGEFTLNNDVLVQIFTPIVASHRITNCQFGNSYLSMKCEDLPTICFQEVFLVNYANLNILK